MDPVYTFGFKLAELMNKKDFAGVSLLCLAIKDSGKGYVNLTYDDFKNIFLTYLPKRLESLHVDNSQEIISELMKMLNQNQTIFTLSSH